MSSFKRLCVIYISLCVLCFAAFGAMAQDFASYVLGAEDIIRVHVYGENDLSGSYKIAADGHIAMPLIGAVDVSGRTVPEASLIISSHLADGYLVDPSVSIQIEKYRPFYILGEVHAPGQYEYVANMDVLNAVAVAGGFTYRAKKNGVQVRRGRGNNGEYVDIRSSESVLPGDVLYIPERLF
jgi:polysaccharide export outer membrane protein